MTTHTDSIIAAVMSGPLDRAGVIDRVAGTDRKLRSNISTIIGQILKRGQLRQRDDGTLAPNPAYTPKRASRKPRSTRKPGRAAVVPARAPRTTAAAPAAARTQHARDLARDLVANVEDATDSLLALIDEICEDHPDLARAVRMQRRAVGMLRAGHALVEA